MDNRTIQSEPILRLFLHQSHKNKIDGTLSLSSTGQTLEMQKNTSHHIYSSSPDMQHGYSKLMHPIYNELENHNQPTNTPITKMPMGHTPYMTRPRKAMREMVDNNMQKVGMWEDKEKKIYKSYTSQEWYYIEQ